MQNFTGLNKKSIAGIHCGIFLLFFLSNFSIANEPAPTTTNQLVPLTETVVATNNSIANPVTTAPVNTPKAIPQKVSSTSQLANLIGGLALIIVLIYGLSWFVKRFSQGGFMQNPNMKIVSAMPLGTRERLMLVDVGGKQLLLGVTATQINTLHVFDEPVVTAEKTQPIASEFSQKLMAILQQKNFTPADDAAHKKSNS